MKTAVLALALAAFATPALADGCDGLIAALVKGAHTPWHSKMSQTRMGTPEASYETIALPDRLYTRVRDGAWGSKPVDAAKNEEKIRKDWARSTCKPGGTETLDGESASIVLHHSAGGGITVDTRFWIGDGSGLVLKTETKQRIIVVTSVYDYKDVKAPVEK
jgi:hypothetical protein